VPEEQIAGCNVERRGSGPPLLLVHGIGHRWQLFTPLLDDLAADHEVVAVDVPGFGASPPLPPDVPPDIAHLADTLEAVLDALGWDAPDIAGSSMGGWLGLELARRGRARSVTGLCSAGLWNGKGHQLVARAIFKLMLVFSRRGTALIPLLRFAAVRTMFMFGTFGKPWKVPGDIAIADAHAFAASDFDRTFAQLKGVSFEGGREITAPITLTYADFDPLVKHRASTHDELPPTVEVVRLPWCGHVPTWDDPARCIRVIRSTMARAVPAPA
jgi:pimeloyl-ACP methyl ester carboxylesterase